MSARRALCAALVFALGAVAVYVLAFHTTGGHDYDGRLLIRLARYPGTTASDAAQGLAVLCNTIPYALLAFGMVALGRLTRGRRGTVVIAGVLTVPLLVTEVLKHVTAVDRGPTSSTLITHIDPVSWPSGHSTAAMALGLSLVLAAPAGWRVLAALVGLAFAGGVGASVVMLGWHYPSDVAGGYLVAACGASFGAALLPGLSRQAATTALRPRSLHARG